jgi:exosortase F-associated protein
MDFPRREILKLTFFTSLRYGLNSLISLGIIYLFFKDKSIVKFSGFIYTVAYAILILIFLYFVINPRQEDYYLFFNFRRFLIQPVLLLLLLPAFYYYKLKQ